MIEVGARVFDKYEILRRLAVGGMGEIFLARQTGLVERLVILKSLLPDLADQQDQLDQFLDEARVCANLNHPNIVAIYDVGLWEGVYFIAMEYIAGEDLSHLTKAARAANVRIPLEVAAAIVRDAAAGLDHAHSASDAQGRPLNLVHRDISPQNIMVRTDGVVKVVDFGIARAANKETKTAAGVIKGKYRYMSPEQALDRPLDGRSDQFALGAVLWELVTGQRLFGGESPVQILTAVVRNPTPPPSTLLPNFPPALEGVILKMTAKERDERYARCGEVAAALRAWLETVPKANRPDVAPLVQRLLGEKIAEKSRAAPPDRTRADAAPLCPQCGKANAAGNRFCGTCGAALGSASHGSQSPRSAPGTGRSTSSPGSLPGTGRTSSPGSVPGTGRTSSPGSVPGTGRTSSPGTSPGMAGRTAATRSTASPVPPPGATPSRSPPSPIAATLAEGAAAQIGGAMRDLSQLMAGEKRTATVLAASFTGLAELRRALDAEGVAEATSGLLDELSEIAERFEGSVHQLDTDRMTFVFGVPVAHPDDPARALECALALRTAAAAAGTRLGVPALGLRAGVDAGPMVVTGSRRGAARLSGAPLAGAQRLEESAPAGAVLASAAVQLSTRATMGFAAKEYVVRRPGEEEPLRAAECTGPRKGSGGLGGETSALLGRARELSAVQARLQQVAGGTPACLLLVGDAGVGKSRLLAEVADASGRHKVLVARAQAERANAAELALVVHLLHAVCRSLAATRPGSREDATALTYAGVGNQSLARVSAVLEGKPRPSTSEARLAEDADLAEALAAGARVGPLLLAVDDVHLADPRSLSVLQEAVRRAAGRPFALVATCSAQSASTLGFSGAQGVQVAPLSPEDAVAVAAQYLGGALPERAAAIVRERALGNPYYARQLAQLMVDTGALQKLADAWQVSPAIEQLAVPTSLQLAVEAQLDRLPSACLTLVRVAAAAGPSFSQDLLRGAVGGEFPLEEALSQAVERQVLAPVPGAAETYRFSQALLQDLLLGKALRSDLKQIHLRLAQAIEAGAPPPEGDRERALADHYLAAEVADRAIYWTSRAATELQARGLLGAAATYYRQSLQTALPVLARPPVTERNASWLLTQLAQALPCLARASQDEAILLADAVLGRLAGHLCAAERAEALRQKALLLVQASRIPEAERALEEALRLSGRLHDVELQATLLGDLGAALEARGDLEGAAQRLSESFSTIGGRPTRNQDFYWEHLNRLGRVYAKLGNTPKAREFFELAREQARRVSSLPGETKALINTAGVLASEGTLTDALMLLEHALELAGRSGDRVDQARIHYNAGRLLASSAKPTEARQRLEQAAATARDVGWREGVALASQALDGLR